MFGDANTKNYIVLAGTHITVQLSVVPWVAGFEGVAKRIRTNWFPKNFNMWEPENLSNIVLAHAGTYRTDANHSFQIISL